MNVRNYTFQENHEAHLKRGIRTVETTSGEYVYCVAQCIHLHGGGFCGFRLGKRPPATKAHDSNSCSCEMCRFAGDFEKSRSKSPSDSSKARKGQDEFLESGGENVLERHLTQSRAISAGSTFEHEWLFAPSGRKHRVEMEDALFWYTTGARAKEAELMEVFNSDLREILRVAKERVLR